MESRTILPFSALSFETITSLAELGNFVRIVAARLYDTAYENKLEVAGSIQWIYRGADQNPDTRFELTILLPVITRESMIENTEFRIKTIDTFKAVGKRHVGSWAALGNTYAEIFSALQTQNLTPDGEIREYYVQMDFENPERNITEVLVGVK